MKMPIRQIVVGERHRKDMGDLDALASSIADIGLLQPIGVSPDNRLIFGERRLRACRDILGLTEIEARVIDMPSIVVGESAENEVRKDFTVSERVAIAAAIREELGERRGRPSNENVQEIAEIKKGQKTTDFAARKAGFGNRETFRQAEHVVTHAEPELVQAMDEGKVSILAAHRAAKLPAEQQREVAKTGRTLADAERENDRRARERAEKEHPLIKTVTITEAVMAIANADMTAAEFVATAPAPTRARLHRHALPAYRFLREMVEVVNDQARTG